MLAAVAQLVKKDRDHVEIAVIVDGSTLRKSDYLMKKLRAYRGQVCAPRNIRIDLIPSSSVILKGTACAALVKANKEYRSDP